HWVHARRPRHRGNFAHPDPDSGTALLELFFGELGLEALRLGHFARDHRGDAGQLCSSATRSPTAAGRYFAGLKLVKGEISLSCRDIERYLGQEEERVHALRGVSLDIEAGSVHAVVGPSGCG